MRSIAKKLPWTIATLIGLALLAYGFLPSPVIVDTVTVKRGDLQVTVDEDGKTRIRERYVVSTPLAGRVSRIELHAGDKVTAAKTELATLHPTIPTLLDERAKAEAEARVKATEAALRQAEAQFERAQAVTSYARTDYERRVRLHTEKSVSHEELDQAELKLKAAAAEQKSLEFGVRVATFEHEQAKAALVQIGSEETSTAGAPRMILRSPIDGVVLRVLHEDAGLLPASTPILEVGDVASLEVVVDVLSSDAVGVHARDAVLIEDWGGSQPLRGTVRLVEPAGFTKISALGVEEQRVNVLVDLVTPPEERSNLGDGFRVEARIIISNATNVVLVPNSALFRSGDDWAVFVVEQQRAVQRIVKIGRRSELESEVLAGLIDQDVAVVFPGDKVRNGVKVLPRSNLQN